MAKVLACPVPPGSLLAEFGSSTAYRDCFACEVPGLVTLPELIERFYCSPAFRPERLALGLIGRGASNADVHALASGEVQSFAAWNVVERRSQEILLQDFQQATASWLSVRPGEGTTTLLFGSWVDRPDRGPVRLLMPFHRFYSRVLLGGV